MGRYGVRAGITLFNRDIAVQRRDIAVQRRDIALN